MRPERYVMNMRKIAVIGVITMLGAASAILPAATAAPAPQADGSASEHQCNTGAAAAIGGLLGALAGRGKGHLAGAAVGAGIGALACTAYNYHVRKLQDANAVNAAYQQQHGSIPADSTVASYNTTLEPSTVQAGSDVTAQSTVTIVGGQNGAQPQVSEELVLITPDGKVVSSDTKPSDSISGGGEYQTNFRFTLPKGIPDGQYTVRTTLLLNGDAERTNNSSMQVIG